MDEELVEKVADFVHDQWIHWMKYMFTKMEDTYHHETKQQTGMFTPVNLVNGWKGLMKPYAELTEKKKDSDREWARKIIAKFIICEYCKERTTMDICNTCRTDSKVWDDY